MKRIRVIPIVFAFLFVACTSDPAVDAAFSRYSGKDGVTSITVPGFAVRAATMFADMDTEEKEILKKVDLVKVLAVDSKEKYKQINFYKEFGKLVTADYQPLLTVKDGNDNVNVMAKMISEEEISDLLIVIGGNDNVIIYLKGKFNLNEIAEESKHLKNGSWKSMVKM